MRHKASETVRVFVSSTFHDMHAERDHLVRFVFPRLRERLLPHHIRLIDVDLRWGISTGQDVTTVCYDTIDRCRPWFVALLGERYGWIPPGTERSITELEIDYAAFTPNRPARPLFYFRDPGALESVPPRVSFLYSEETRSQPSDDGRPAGLPKDRRQRLAVLKSRIRQAGFRTSTYSAAWNPDFQCLTELQDFGRQVEDDLWAGISSDPQLAANFAGGDSLAEDIDYDDVFDQAAIDPWFGRRQELRGRLAAFAGGSGGAFVLRGAPGSGKTTTLRTFCRELTSGNVVLLSYFAGRDSETANIADLLRKFLRFFDPGTKLPNDCSVLAARLRRRLVEAVNERDLLIVVDGIDQVDAAEGVTATDWLPDIWPERLRVLISTRAEGLVAGLPKDTQDFTLPAIEPTEAGQLLQGIFAEYSKTISEEHIAVLLRKEESSSPLYLYLAAEELRVAGRYEALTGQIAELPGSVEPLLLWALGRSARETGFRDSHGKVIAAELVRITAALLAASRRGLSHRELQGLLEPQAGAGNVSALMRSVRNWFVESGELVWFRHPRIGTAVRDRYLTDPVTAHTLLADYFQERLKHDTGQHNRRRALAELPFHLFHARRFDELWALARSATFLDEQRAVPSDAPEVVSHTMLLALEAAARQRAPKEMAEFILRTGDELGGSRSESPLDALRSGRSDPSAALPEADADSSVLWPLLLASELGSQNRREEAEGLLRKLRVLELSRLPDEQKWIAVFLLADAWTVDPVTAAVLTSKLLDDGTRVQLATHLETRQLYGAAADVCSHIELTHTRFDAFQSLAESLLKSGHEEEAKGLFGEVAAALEASALTVAPEYAVIEASATALAGRPELAVGMLHQRTRQVTVLQQAWVVSRAAWAYGQAGQIESARDGFVQIRTLADDVLQQWSDKMTAQIVSAWLWLLIAEWSRDSMEAAYADDAIKRSWAVLDDPQRTLAACMEEDTFATPGESNLEYLERVIVGIAVESARADDLLDPTELEETIQRLRPHQSSRAWLEIARCHAKRNSLSKAEKYWLKALAQAQSRTTAVDRSVDLGALGNHWFYRFRQNRGLQVLSQAREEGAAWLVELDRRRDLDLPLAIAYARLASTNGRSNWNHPVWRERSFNLLTRAQPTSSVLERVAAIMIDAGDFEGADRALELIPESRRSQSAARLAERLVQEGRDAAIRYLMEAGLLSRTRAWELEVQFHKAIKSGELQRARELRTRSPSLAESADGVGAWIRALCEHGHQAEAMEVLDKEDAVPPQTLGSLERMARAWTLLQRALWLAEVGHAEDAERAFEASEQETSTARDGWSVFRMMAGLAATEVSKLEAREEDVDATEAIVRAAPFFCALARGGARNRARELLRDKQAALNFIRGSVPRSKAAAVLAKAAAEAGEFEIMVSLTDQIADRRAEHLEEVAEAAFVWRHRLDQQEWLDTAIGPLLKHAAGHLDAGIRLCGVLAEIFPDHVDEIGTVLEGITHDRAM